MQNCHRLFLQSFMSKFIMDSKAVTALHKNACASYQVEYSADRLVEFVQTINMNILPFHMEIKKGINESSGASAYALVNVSESCITKLASDYTQNELEFFKKIVEGILESEDGAISTTDALNLADDMQQRISKKDAQDLLLRLQRGLWLEQDREGYLLLNTRALIELDQYIKEQYPDHASKCELCHRLCVKGQKCSQCEIKLHIHCASRLLGGKEDPRCPSKTCSAQWEHDIPLLKSKDASGDTQPNPSQAEPSTSQSQTRKRKTRR